MSSAYTRFVSGVVFPLHEALKGHDTVRKLRALEDSQWWERERLEAYRARRLREFLARALVRVPYYRGLGVDPDAGLETWPFLTKDIIRDNRQALVSEDAGPLVLFNTGGSTGAPLQFFLGKERVSHDVAAKWRATRWWGVDIGDPEIVVWGSPVELGAQGRVRAVRDRLLRTRLLPAFEMSEAKLDGFVRKIRRARPRMLFGYPSSLSLIAEHARRVGVDLTGVGIEVAFVTSEQLYPHQREAIASGFGCRVANGYGGRDFGFVAHECPEGGLHTSAEDIVVEIVGEGDRVLPPGEEGEIVVTHLATGEFPFIRYRTGDIGKLSLESCPCGRGLLMLDTVVGRTTDFIVAADGTVMHALALIYAIRDVPGVREFKIVQESLAETRVLLVTESGFPAEREREIERRLLERLGSGVRVVLEHVPQIPRSPAGKHRFVESRVGVDRGGGSI